MPDALLPGIAATRVPTGRLTQSVLHPEGVAPDTARCRARAVIVTVSRRREEELTWPTTCCRASPRPVSRHPG